MAIARKILKLLRELNNITKGPITRLYVEKELKQVLFDNAENIALFILAVEESRALGKLPVSIEGALERLLGEDDVVRKMRTSDLLTVASEVFSKAREQTIVLEKEVARLRDTVESLRNELVESNERTSG